METVLAAILVLAPEMSGKPGSELARVVAVEAVACEGVPDAPWRLPATAWFEAGFRPDACLPRSCRRRRPPPMLGMYQMNARYLPREAVRKRLWLDPRWSTRTACEKMARMFNRGGRWWMARWFGGIRPGPKSRLNVLEVERRMGFLREAGACKTATCKSALRLRVRAHLREYARARRRSPKVAKR